MTETDLINRRITAGRLLADSDILRQLIQDDAASEQKRRMLEGKRYYEAEHDVLQKDFTASLISETEDGEINSREEVRAFRNPNRSNHHCVHPFHRVLVDQKVSYLLGKEPTVSVAGADTDAGLQEYERLLNEVCDERFNAVLSDLAVGASNKGVEVLHIYYDTAGELRYCITPAEECILVYDTEYQDTLQQVIRYYTITETREDGRKYARQRVEWWTAQDVTYYTQNDTNLYLLDSGAAHNPSPHWWEITVQDGAEVRKAAHHWDRVPFVVLENNAERSGDLAPVKGLIDAYDLLSSDGTNNFLDLVDLYWVIQGYGGETTNAIARKLKINKAVNISDSTGRVEAKQVELSAEGRLEWMKMLRRDIYHLGMGIDVDAETFGSAPSGVSLKFRYAQLDLKANKMVPKLKAAVKDLLWFVTDDYNRRNGTAYDSSAVSVVLTKSLIANDYETVQMINLSKGIVSDDTLLAHHPFVDDVNNEKAALEEQAERERELFDGGYGADFHAEQDNTGGEAE